MRFKSILHQTLLTKQHENALKSINSPLSFLWRGAEERLSPDDKENFAKRYDFDVLETGFFHQNRDPFFGIKIHRTAAQGEADIGFDQRKPGGVIHQVGLGQNDDAVTPGQSSVRKGDAGKPSLFINVAPVQTSQS